MEEETETETLTLFLNSQKRKKLIIRRKQEETTAPPRNSKQEEMVPRKVVGGGVGVEHLFFGTGSQVEVRSDDIGFKGSWYVGTIIEIDDPTPSSSSPISSNKKKRKMEPPPPTKKYLVEYATLVEEGEDKRFEKPLREKVDGSFMRPLPPPTESQHAYELRDVVDAFYRDGWWTGVVVEVLDDGSKFRVLFELPPEAVTFARSELRVHYDWVDCKWVRAEKKNDCTPIKAAISVEGLEGQSVKGSGTKNPRTPKKAAVSVKGLEGQSVKGPGTKNPLKLPGKSSVKSVKNIKKHVNDQHCHDVKEIIEPKSGVSSQVRKRGRPKKLMAENHISLVNGEEKNGAESASYETAVKDSASNDGEQSTLAGIQGLPILNHGYPPQAPLSQCNIMDNVLDVRLAKIDNQISETIAGKSGKKPRSCTSKKQNQWSRTNNKSSTQDSQGPLREKPYEQFEDRPQLMWYDSSTQEACIGKASSESKDRPQLKWHEEMNSPYTVDDSIDLNVVQSADASDGRDESAMQSPAIATCDNNVSEKDIKSPFEKRSPVWATLESMDIFRKMPQRPHFSPLGKSKDDSREGLAIGQMVIFSSVVEKTSRLQFSDPRRKIDSCLETLSDLETYGFDVHPIRRRLKELLSKKENQGHLLEESKEVEMKIAEHSAEKVKIGEEICEINKEMEKLREKLELATAMENMTDYEIEVLKSKMDGIDQDLQNAHRDFERLAAAPW